MHRIKARHCLQPWYWKSDYNFTALVTLKSTSRWVILLLRKHRNVSYALGGYDQINAIERRCILPVVQ